MPSLPPVTGLCAAPDSAAPQPHRPIRPGVAHAIAALLLVGSCSGLANAQSAPERVPANPQVRAAADARVSSLPEVELSPQLLFQLLAAEIAAQRGETGSAAATYLSLARRTRDPRLARRSAELALAARALDRALTAARLWAEIEPDSRMAAQTVEALQLSTGAIAPLEPMLRERLDTARREGKLAEAYEALQTSLLRAPDKKQALAVMERLASPDAGVPAARMAIAAIAHAAEAFDRAAAESLAALGMAPNDESIAVQAARYASLSSAGRASAVTLLETFLERQPRSIEARYALGRLLAQSGRSNDGRTQLELALKQEPDNPAILFTLAQLSAQSGQPAAAQAYLRRYVELPADIQRDNAPALLFLGQLAEEAKRFDEAIAWYSRVESGEQAIVALMRHAILLGRLKRIDEARALLREANATSARERSRLVSAEAQILREAGRYADAFKVIDDALARQPDEPDLLYDHAMAAEKINRLDVLETSLRKLIGARPDHAHAYNALGYTLADRGLRLDEAQSLIEKALQLAPDDAQILDSMGWVLFRRGDLEGAIRYLRKAYESNPEVDIAAHLGEALWKLGKQDEARAIWRDAHQREPGNETLRETLSRLNVSP